MILCDVGEFVVNSVDRDGMMTGFDINLILKVTGLTNIPIIAVGGAGNMNHFKELFEQTNIRAVGASSIFNFTQHTPMDIKNEINNLGIAVRI
jgi:cyclase